MPHSASCERVFSGLRWFYANRQQNLSVNTIESMFKIQHFYFTHTNDELQYNRKDRTKEELNKMLKEFNLFNNNKSEKENENIMEKNIDLIMFDDESKDLGSNGLEDLRESEEKFND
ncbi:unnamed protein product [Rhizophagus irregularis]|uniref:HAT C-terminal dimerisation domain-containing protein n=1 Tax=Rhizophagus irregularis TaxID=588596 RepID=A0A2I1H3B0_9GLOM|nr:hypothetical protein RhiirA4_471482 [Rhizophagus irregularis]CAB4406090.1 unnamed protein product [Rhizophagus irregularis]